MRNRHRSSRVFLSRGITVTSGSRGFACAGELLPPAPTFTVCTFFFLSSPIVIFRSSPILMTAGSFDDPVADTGSSGLASPTLTRATVFESPGSGFSLVPLSLSSGAKDVGTGNGEGTGDGDGVGDGEGVGGDGVGDGVGDAECGLHPWAFPSTQLASERPARHGNSTRPGPRHRPQTTT